jgi:hypothetical protein
MGRKKMKKYFLTNIGLVATTILLFMSTSVILTPAQIPTNVNVNHQIVPDNSLAEARWAANITGTMFRGWLQYSLEKGFAGRRITLTGTWGTDDGNFTGAFTLKNLIFLKFYGTYRGVFLAEVSGGDYTGRFVGFFRNDWEVGYWKTIIPAKMQIQIVHIPFN